MILVLYYSEFGDSGWERVLKLFNQFREVFAFWVIYRKIDSEIPPAIETNIEQVLLFD